MENLEWTLHPVRDDDGNETWCMLRGDESVCLGAWDDVEGLCDKLCEVVENGNHDGELLPDDSRIATWLTIAEASTATGVPETSLRWACRQGYIEGARSDPRRVTLQAIEEWRNGPHAKRRKGGQND